jgi:hypothetical protein
MQDKMRKIQINNKIKIRIRIFQIGEMDSEGAEEEDALAGAGRIVSGEDNDNQSKQIKY